MEPKDWSYTKGTLRYKGIALTPFEEVCAVALFRPYIKGEYITKMRERDSS